MAAYNKSLGKFQLTGIPPAPRGIPQIEVAFDIDANGILSVSAKDLGTGKEQKIEIKSGSGLSDDEIKQMIRDAEEQAALDRRARRRIEMRNNAESTAAQVERQLEAVADRLDESQTRKVQARVEDLRRAHGAEDLVGLEAATEALHAAWHGFSEDVYERPVTARQPGLVRASLERRLPSVFLCHSSDDKILVRRLDGRLRRDGIRTWLDERDLIAGQQWEDAIRQAVRDADVVLVCLSRGSVTKSGYVQKEIRIVLDEADEQPDAAIFLIPVRLEECDVPERLRRWHWVDLYRRGGYNRVLAALREAQGRSLRSG